MISVTQILNPWIETGFFNSEGAERGRQVHAKIAAELLNTYCPALPLAYTGYYRSAQEWIKRVNPDILFVEPCLIHEDLCFCGHPDLICRIAGQPAIVDWKTGQSAAWHPIQLAGYIMLARQKYPEYQNWKPLTVQLFSDCRMGKETDYSPIKRQSEAVFISALNCHNFFKPKGGNYAVRD